MSKRFCFSLSLTAFLLLSLPVDAQLPLPKESRSVIRLKADEARRLGMDSLPEYEKEMLNYSEALLKEAFQKDSKNGQLRKTFSSRTMVRLNRLTLPLSASASVSQFSSALSRMSQLRDKAAGTNAWPEAQQGMLMEKETWMDVLDLTEEESALVRNLEPGSQPQVVSSPVGIHLVQVLEGPLSVDQEGPGYLTDALALDSWARSLDAYRLVSINEAAVSHIRQGSAIPGEVVLSLGGHNYTVEQFQKFQESTPLSLQRQVERFAALCVAREESARLLPQDSLESLLGQRQDEWLASRLTEERVIRVAERDSAGLESYFLSHLDDYAYSGGAFRGVVVHASSKKVIKDIKKLLRKLPKEEWPEALRLVFGESGRIVRYDSGLFFPGDDAFVDEEAFSGRKPRPLIEYPVSLVMGDKIRYPESLDPIRQDVLMDYMSALNREWVRRLEKK